MVSVRSGNAFVGLASPDLPAPHPTAENEEPDYSAASPLPGSPSLITQSRMPGSRRHEEAGDGREGQHEAGSSDGTHRLVLHHQ